MRVLQVCGRVNENGMKHWTCSGGLIAKWWQGELDMRGRNAGTWKRQRRRIPSRSHVLAVLEEGPLMSERNLNVRLNIPTERALKGLHICVLNEGAEN